MTNVTDRKIENCQAVVQFHTESGDFITSDTALIEFNPLLPGQTSPWKVMTRHNPAMNQARVSFKVLFGGSVPAMRKAEYDELARGKSD